MGVGCHGEAATVLARPRSRGVGNTVPGVEADQDGGEDALSVRVFRNLTRRCVSVQARVRGAEGAPARWRTVAHALEVSLRDARFTVSAAGRARTLRSGKKCVHAWVEGHLDSWEPHGAGVRPEMPEPALAALLACLGPVDAVGGEPVRYNPRLAGHFFRVEDGALVARADRASVSGHGVRVLASPVHI